MKKILETPNLNNDIGKRDRAIIELIYSSALRRSELINLEVDGKSIEVLVHDYQQEPVTGSYLHVDFLAVVKWEAVHTKIHLEFNGNSPAVKEWGILEEKIKEIEVKVLPKDLVDSIEVDLSQLKEMWDSIKVSDLNIDSKKMEVFNNSDDVVAMVSKPRKVKEEETTTEESSEDTEESK